MNRRHFLTATGALTLETSSRAFFPSIAGAIQSNAKPDFTLRIAPVSVELAPGRLLKTVGYNGSVPGPLLRVREVVLVTVDVFNDSDSEELLFSVS